MRRTVVAPKAGLSGLRQGQQQLQRTVRRIEVEGPLADSVYASLGAALRRGEFTPGQSLKLRTLADALGTSQTPVREALSRLVAQNALQFHPVNRSVIVPVLTREEVREIYEVRIRVESMAAEKAALLGVDAAQLDLLRAAEKDLEVSARANATSAFLRKNQQFLFSIYTAAAMPRLLSIIEGLWLQIGPTLGMLLAGFDDIIPIAQPQAYRELLQAIEQHDAKMAGRVIARRLKVIQGLIIDSMG